MIGLSSDAAARYATYLTDPWWAIAKVRNRWPLSTESVAKLFAAGGYLVSVADLVGLVNRKMIEPPALENGDWLWKPVDVFNAYCVFDVRGQFNPSCPDFEFKKSHAQIELEQYRADGKVKEFMGGRRPDLAWLLGSMLDADRKEQREALVAFAKACLQADHGVLIP
jgi:hypothetical protein